MGDFNNVMDSRLDRSQKGSVKGSVKKLPKSLKEWVKSMEGWRFGVVYMWRDENIPFFQGGINLFFLG